MPEERGSESGSGGKPGTSATAAAAAAVEIRNPNGQRLIPRLACKWQKWQKATMNAQGEGQISGNQTQWTMAGKRGIVLNMK